MDNPSEDSSGTTPPPEPGSDQGVYFVPYRWWKDANVDQSNGKKGIVYAASPALSYSGPMKLINNIFSPDLTFNLRREDSVQNDENGEVGVSGRDFALVSGEMWVEALKWYSDSKVTQKENRGFSAAEDDISDVYPIQLRLTVMREANTLAVRVCKKDNSAELFKRACKIFSVDIELLRIWDFSGRTALFFLSDNGRFMKDCPRQADQEVLLELQIYGLSDSIKCKDGKKEDKGLQHYPGSSLLNGSISNESSDSVRILKSSGEAGSLGLTGLQNLGNTCFMNSALQCLAHTPKLVDYFLGNYTKEINHGNPLGMDGEIALAFGDLLRKLWEPGAAPLAPKTFKMKLARFAPQFSGFNQHDSQELLAFLLDGLHEDLNRVKCKPYIEAKDTEDQLDEELADEYWHYHLARNNSIIVDVCQGQFKSTLVCPLCKKVSVTFDPFMYLSLPLPSTMTRTMTITVVSLNGSAKPTPYTITVPKNGKFEDLIQALSTACSLGIDETLLVVEVYNNRIIRFLDDPSDFLKLIRDEDRLVAYRLPKESKEVPLVVFTHQTIDERHIPGSFILPHKGLGIPLVSRLGSSVNGSDICNIFLGVLNQFRKPSEDVSGDHDDFKINSAEDPTSNLMGKCPSHVSDADVNSSDKTGIDLYSDSEFQFYMTDEKGIAQGSRITLDEPVGSAGTSGRLNILVFWSEKHIKEYDPSFFSPLPEILKSGFFVKQPQETVSLYKCLEAFLTEEPLGPEDMWSVLSVYSKLSSAYCPCIF
ncbi:hypothetical protein SAY87_013671 [Trapa incisa]|uniref:ubiquitinyl hydrolase 1 n=1 Tax=Trapa incisa TaxID=236973 RepID=A0AAN7K931_9MYRT|nr:hypothetical protein SAY87_013671 [Trapa incisa]